MQTKVSWDVKVNTVKEKRYMRLPHNEKRLIKRLTLWHSGAHGICKQEVGEWQTAKRGPAELPLGQSETTATTELVRPLK